MTCILSQIQHLISYLLFSLISQKAHFAWSLNTKSSKQGGSQIYSQELLKMSEFQKTWE